MTSALQLYLEQLYKRNAGNASPELQPGMRADAVKQAAVDAMYRPQAPVRPHITSPGARIPHDPMDTLRSALEGSWNAQGMAGSGMADAITRNQVTDLNYNHPDYYQPKDLHDAHHTNQLASTINSIRANSGRDIEDESKQQSLSANLAAQNAPVYDPLGDIEAQIRALAGRPDIPGHWESPYSQDYLNGLGNRLQGAGADAQQQFADAKNSIAADYAQGIAGRAQTQDTLTNALQANGQNIGVDYQASQQGQQAKTDRDYLTQVTEANRANDFATNDKLGVLANQFGANLGMQAREGLLTPKQWIDAQSGLSSGDKALMGFLQDQYGDIFGAQQDAAAQAAQSGSLTDFAKSLTNGADEDIIQNWPDVVQGLAGLKNNPQLMDAANRIWNMEGDPAAAVKYLETDYKKDNPTFNAGPPPTRPPGAGANPQQLARMLEGFQQNVATYNQNKNDQNANNALWQQLLDFFNQYNPNRQAVVSSRKVTNSSSAKSSSKS